MKKTYINPTMTVVKLNHRPLLQSGSTPKLGGTYSGGSVLSREMDDIDDFDE